MPVCSRCVEKNVACVYSKTRTASRPDKRAKKPTTGPETPLDFTDLSFDMDYLEDIPTSFHTDLAVEPTPNSVQDTISSSDISMDTFMNLIGNNSSSSSDHWPISAEEDHLLQRPVTPADEEVARGYEKMMVCCFATCLLYVSRTPANMAMVMRALSDNARELVDIEVCRVPSAPIEKLARSQALFLYQIIRLFDGDVALRAQGEKDMGLLKTWLGELCHIRDNLGDLARLEYTSVREQPPVEWEKWIFAECVRRTIIMAYGVMGLYEILKDPQYLDPINTWAYAHRWTLGRSLWNAGSPAEFQRAWKDSSHFVIANFAFDNFLEYGKGEDVDEFAEVILNTYMGMDAMKEFTAARETKQAAVE
ncbi:hypothetical protein F4859DRAFT_512490 [Xylaria cf. heliscus]|nr:hypothetical protein F4859DRAFT_512490 [Xylaria cf. heliscus]